MARTIATLDHSKTSSSKESALATPKYVSPEALAEASRAMGLIEEAQRVPGVMAGVQDQYASLMQTYVAKFGAAGPAAGDDMGREVKFDSHDILGWAGSLLTYVKGLHKFDFKDPAVLAEALPNKAKIAVFGDWATGLYGAPKVAESIVRDGAHDLLLHLGDTYYSGDDEEVDDGLIGMWPKVPGAISRSLNGNHEMYTGGTAYMNAVTASFGQQSSYFAYQNDNFILGCLDTSYDNHDLHGEQATWVGKLIAQAGGRKLILFSHHQPFSLLDSEGPRLVAKLSPYLEAKQIFAWYWGHEHRCVLYDKHAKWGVIGRCIGHGGFPEFRNKVPGSGGTATRFLTLPEKNLSPGGKVLDGPNPQITDHPDKYGPHGYVTLNFDGGKMIEQIRSATGEVLLETQLV